VFLFFEIRSRNKRRVINIMASPVRQAPVINSLSDLHDLIRSLQVFRIPPHKIELSPKSLGDGAFGSVWRATFAGRKVAVKRFSLLPVQDQEPWFLYQSIARELWTLSLLRNLPFVVRLVGVVHDLDGTTAAAAAAPSTVSNNEVWLVLELVIGQSLADARAPADRVQWAFDILRLLANQFVEVHELGVAHLDLNPRNVMLTPDGEIHLIDFGMSLLTALVGGATLPSNAAVGGTHGYMPPEQVCADVDCVNGLLRQRVAGCEADRSHDGHHNSSRHLCHRHDRRIADDGRECTVPADNTGDR
jgi:hypothetical protein